MPLIKLQFKPGINSDQTAYSGEGSWYDCDKIRFRTGYPQKIGGWVKSTFNTFIGTCRQLFSYATSYSDNLMAVGTESKLYLEDAGGTYWDITPLRTTDPTFSSPNTDNCVQTFIGSKTVQINLGVPSEAATGSYVVISGVSGTVGGIPASNLNGNFLLTYVGANSFSIQVATAASSNVSAGGGTSIVTSFEIAPGYSSTVAGYGWGTSTWGRSTWGSGSTTPVMLRQRDWWYDQRDNDMICNIRYGAPYYWQRGLVADPTTALTTKAITLQQYATNNGYNPNAVPSATIQMIVSQQDKHILAFGAVPFGSTDPALLDPLLIRWADQDNPGQWTPLATNTAGDLHVSRGSRIVTVLPVQGTMLVWTDTTLYSLTFLGTTDVFGLQPLVSNVSIISPRAKIIASNVTYWMGSGKFYAYTGVVSTMGCTVRNHVFNNMNYGQLDQIVCGTDEQWNEVWWFYPSQNSNWNDSYVVFNYTDNIWYYGSMSRTAWLDAPLRGSPQATSTGQNSTTGYLYSHEIGVDDDTLPMTSFVLSDDYDIGDGDQFMLMKRIIPDMDFSGSTATSPTVTMQIQHRNFPGSLPDSEDSDSDSVVAVNVTAYTKQLFIRARARQMALKIYSQDLGVQWSLGSTRIDARTDGRR